MTKLDEIHDMLTATIHANERGEDILPRLRMIRRELRYFSLEEELRLRLSENLKAVKDALGPRGELAFEIATNGNEFYGSYSVGIGSKHAHTFDVHGRGSSIEGAIKEALKVPKR